jgi:hypothetical protein
MPEIIDDLVVIGLATPQHLKNGRTTVCLGGWSETCGFIRIYPMPPGMGLHRWDIISVEVEKNNQDTRHESWKIVGSRTEWDSLDAHVEQVGKITSPFEKRQIIVNNSSPCVNIINDNMDSLGFVKIEKLHKAYFDKNPQFGKPIQMALFASHAQDWAKVKRDYELEPRLKFTCPDCQTKRGFHDHGVLEWGWYEWMRKNPDNMGQVFENALLYSDKHDIYAFVGNQQNQRTSFKIINAISVQKNPKKPPPKQLPMFD